MNALIVVGLGCGDEGKGGVVDALTRRYNARLTVRFNGGCQAAHNVVEDTGRHHTFSQFGSGTLAGARTFLDSGVMVNPLLMQAEEERLRKIGVTDAWERMAVHGRCLLTTPYHRAVNRLRELSRGRARHGSCGNGIGETAMDAIERGSQAMRIEDLQSASKTRQMLLDTRAEMLHKVRSFEAKLDYEDDLVSSELSTFVVPLNDVIDRYHDWVSKVRIIDEDGANKLVNSESTVFEGAQGVLIDQDFGFHPYTTWSKTTLENALRRLKHADYRHPMTRIGVIRTYATRHGPGPLVTEDKALTELLPDKHNGLNAWQREFRCGWPDMPALRYALEVNGAVECLAVTHCDQLEKMPSWKICTDYSRNVLIYPHDLNDQEETTRQLYGMSYTSADVAPEQVMPFFIRSLGVPVWMTSYGPRSGDKQFYQQIDEAVKEPVVA